MPTQFEKVEEIKESVKDSIYNENEIVEPDDHDNNQSRKTLISNENLQNQ